MVKANPRAAHSDWRESLTSLWVETVKLSLAGSGSRGVDESRPHLNKYQSEEAVRIDLLESSVDDD